MRDRVVGSPSEHSFLQEEQLSTTTIQLEHSVVSRVFLLTVSVTLGCVSGSLYGFGRYDTALRTVLDASQMQVQSLGIWMDIGNYLGHPITGWIYDFFGPSVACKAAAVILSLAFMTIHLCLRKALSADSDFHLWWVLTAAFTGVGFGSGLGYISALGTVSKKFQGSWAVGWVAAGYGLSSTLVAFTYSLTGLTHMFAVWAVIGTIPNTFGSIAFSNRDLALEQPASNDGLGNDSKCSNEDAGSDNPHVATVKEELERLLDPLHHQLGLNSRWNSWQKYDFWFLYLAFACITGCGLFVINNVSSFVQSQGLPDSYAERLVVFQSACNVLGRIVVGLAVHEGQYFHFLRGASLLMTIGLSTSALLNSPTSLVFTIGGVAAAYGASWVLIVGVLKEWYGKYHFGKDYGIIAMGPALSGLVFNSLSSIAYQHHADRNTGVCVGAFCFKRAFATTATASLIGSLLLSIMFARGTTRDSSVYLGR